MSLMNSTNPEFIEYYHTSWKPHKIELVDNIYHSYGYYVYTRSVIKRFNKHLIKTTYKRIFSHPENIVLHFR
ncbi:hypothetical protein CsVMVgp2 [Cassava vein mosaic virus]|uniref:Uncharacterized 9 kDa protein n=1 Tax=Cassava vein mosaic virus TaxID=38062 RepID=YP09_CSVMV|nr:hypothetical protein CsVMVgp2 [Cassava vein mosaic virus]Q89635.1 RecName: Full=Uncharacterized 9 kDa protein [Cassava vein mosaic virus]AAA79872.1 ORF II [Cassava vein mosaic virus]AAB03326.1 ORF 2 [Cassava vein mosaic virus]